MGPENWVADQFVELMVELYLMWNDRQASKQAGRGAAPVMTLTDCALQDTSHLCVMY